MPSIGSDLFCYIKPWSKYALKTLAVSGLSREVADQVREANFINEMGDVLTLILLLKWHGMVCPGMILLKYYGICLYQKI